MRTFVYESVEQAYPGVIKTLLEEGVDVSPRGKLTKEITPACITITNPRKRVLPSAIRKLNFGFMCAELVWILEASNDVDFIGHYNSNWKAFSDDGLTLNGAYGRRIFAWDSGIRIVSSKTKNEKGEEEEKSSSTYVTINQFQEAYKLLKADPDTRQATIVFFDPYKDYRETKDKPCTNLIRFMIREGKLNMTTFMRSNDIWFGFPYDVFNFTMLQEVMAGMLGVEVGVYNHIADSLHIYETEFEKGRAIVEANENLLYGNETIDARVPFDNLTRDYEVLFNVEKETRENQTASIEEIVNKISSISNSYWQSIATVLATYNFRKYGRNQSDIDTLKVYITNEFSELTKNWIAKK